MEEIQPIPGAIEGRAIHYQLGPGDGVKRKSVGQRRAGTIVRYAGGAVANLNVQLDGVNDVDKMPVGSIYPAEIAWFPSRPYSEGAEPGTWRFMDRA